MRFAIDTGGTFTDLVLEDEAGRLHMFKHPTTPDDPAEGVVGVLDEAARAFGVELPALLGQGEYLLHATTRAINALLTGTAARTAFLATEGHRDILLLREGGRINPYEHTQAYPAPYVPRHLSFGIVERIGPEGQVEIALDEQQARETLRGLPALGVEAIGVCLLWSIANPAHELRLGELIEEELPGIPYTLSHALNPVLREYRRASSTCIDASLKPLMSRYLESLESRLTAAGFRGRLLVVTSTGGVMEAGDVARAPIHVINSGPSMAPLAGRYFAALEQAEGGSATAVVADTGGTTFDVSVIRRGQILSSRETWIGRPYAGHLTGFSSIDIRSVGAGGGSLAWVDEGGLLHVGPESAGAEPGPACYGRGGVRPTVTDASLVLGHLDAATFLGGRMPLDVEAARAAIERDVATPLGIGVVEAAIAIRELATERMVGAIEEITVNQGIDPATATIVAGGGAAGLNICAIANRLGAPTVVIPEAGPALSAAGALMADLTETFFETSVITTERFDFDRANQTIARLRSRAAAFLAAAGGSGGTQAVELSVEARYPGQIWEIELPLPVERFTGSADVDAVVAAFHALHREIFAISDDLSPVELIGWRARAVHHIAGEVSGRIAHDTAEAAGAPLRRVHVAGGEAREVPVYRVSGTELDSPKTGPCIVESPFTTVVLEGPWTLRRSAEGSLVIDLGAGAEAATAGARRGEGTA